jgi:serine/threonine protein phosphatase PrpC
MNTAPQRTTTDHERSQHTRKSRAIAPADADPVRQGQTALLSRSSSKAPFASHET